MMSIRSLGLWCCLALGAGSAVAASAQATASAPVPEAPALEERAEVVAVEVPVNVIDRDGRPLRGLRGEDFQIFDDGQPQKLSGFEVIDLDVLSRATAGESAPTPAAGRMPASLRRHVLLLFDLSYSTPTSILKARLAARDFVLHDLQPSDLGAIATVSLEHGVQLVVTFTPDRSQLARGIDTLGLKQRADAFARTDPLQFMISPPEQQVDLLGRSSSSQSGERAEAVRDELRDYLGTLSLIKEREQRTYDSNRIRSVARILTELARTLATVAGRKQVVLFSEGFDSRLMLGRTANEVDEQQQDALDAASGEIWKVDSNQRFGSTEVQGAIARMLEEFRRADCVIQAVDVGGLRAGADQTPGQRGPGQDALFYLANETGGELVRDANRMRPELEKVLRGTAVTYLLAFQRSDLKADGAYHRITLKAKLPAGARIAHRSGYYAPRPFPQLPVLERNLLASDSISAGVPQRDLQLSVLAAAFRTGERRAYVPVIVEVGGAGLLEGLSGDRVGVEIYAYVSDEHGEMQDFFSQVVSFSIAKDRQLFRESGLKYYGHLELVPGRYLVRVLVRNSVSGRAGVETVSLLVPDYASPVLLPPFFIEPPGRWLLVRESSGQAQSVVYPFVVKGEPYVPAALPRLATGQGARLCLVGYNLGDRAPQLVSEVLAAGGRKMSGGRLDLVERTATAVPGYDHLLAAFSPEGLPPGSYTLRVGLGSGQPSNEIPFEVVN